MRAYERLLKYVCVDTQSCEDTGAVPSTGAQLELANMLAQELKELGMSDVRVTENAYVYALLPASAGLEGEETIGFIAHLDTAPDFSGANVTPRVIENYDGGDVILGMSGRVLTAEKFPDLLSSVGETLIVTDGMSLLGADDKAGVAEIMTLCERLINSGVPHRAVAVCFSPDEEIGHGAELLDIGGFGAAFAYTVDGGAVNEINYETFNAAAAELEVNGVNVHPGSAKDIMINASLVAMEINSLLPPEDVPSQTEGYEGFFHLLEMSGSVERAKLKYIVRDHDALKFSRRCELLKDIARRMNEKYGADTVKLTLKMQYRNMAEKLSDRMDIVRRAERAIESVGLAPERLPVRGGTDGAQLTFRGLPCPNLGTGGYGFHGPYEHITAEAMDKAVDIITYIVTGV